MKPRIRIYAGSLVNAFDFIREKRMRHPDPNPQRLWAYSFPSSAALLAFVLGFGSESFVDDDTVLIPDRRKGEADAYLRQLEFSTSVESLEIFSIEVWSEEDEAAFDERFG